MYVAAELLLIRTKTLYDIKILENIMKELQRP
jgi:hypothetical protein